MNILCLKPTALFACLAVVCLAGCGQKLAAPTTELEKAAKVMAEPANPAPAQPAPQPVQPTAAPVHTPAQQVQQAMTSYKSDQLTDAVVQLQTLRAKAAMSPEQRLALQDAMAAVMTDIYARAAKGDARAQQAVKEYERMQNAR